MQNRNATLSASRPRSRRARRKAGVGVHGRRVVAMPREKRGAMRQISRTEKPKRKRMTTSLSTRTSLRIKRKTMDKMMQDSTRTKNSSKTSHRMKRRRKRGRGATIAERLKMRAMETSRLLKSLAISRRSLRVMSWSSPGRTHEEATRLARGQSVERRVPLTCTLDIHLVRDHLLWPYQCNRLDLNLI